MGWGSIEMAVKELLKYKSKGILTCCNFNDTMLYSDTVTLDSATGKTKEEYEQYDKKQEEFRKTISELTDMWIEKGKQILDKDKWDYWAEIVPIRLNDLYQGMELGYCLDIVKILNNNGTLEEAKEEINKQGHSGMSFELVCSMVKEFCERGEEFVKYVS